MIKLLYKAISFILYPIYRYVIIPNRVTAGKEDPHRFKEKFGYTKTDCGAKPVVWFHAASVGESLSLLKLVQGIIMKYPNLQILITTGTVTSAKMVKERFPDTIIHQFAPLDFAPCINRFLNHWQPKLCILVESEFWPNTILSVKRPSPGW